MQTADMPMEREINGCMVTFLFADEPIEGVLEGVKAILSNSYEERIQSDLTRIVGRYAETG